MHKPERMCAVCRKKGEKNLFIRIVKNNEGRFLIDYTMKADGRGAYICKNSECIKGARVKRAAERSFKTKIPYEFYDELEGLADTFKEGTT